MANWVVEVDGVNHQIEYRGRKIFVDGQRIRVGSKNPFIMLIDYPIVLGSKVVNLVVIGNKADLAVDGIMLGTNEPYVPVDKAPGWTWAFIVIAMIGGWFCIGVFGILINVFLSIFFVREGLALNKTDSHKILVCVLVLVIALVVEGLVGFGIGVWLGLAQAGMI